VKYLRTAFATRAIEDDLDVGTALTTSAIAAIVIRAASSRSVVGPRGLVVEPAAVSPKFGDRDSGGSRATSVGILVFAYIGRGYLLVRGNLVGSLTCSCANAGAVGGAGCGDEHLVVIDCRLVANEVDVEDLGSDTGRSLVVFEGQRDTVGVLPGKQALVESDLLPRSTVEDILSELVEGFKDLGLHSLTDCVLSADFRQSATGHCEVFGHHAQVVVPRLVVADVVTVYLFEGEGRNSFSEFMLQCDLCLMENHVFLVFQYSNHHTVEKVISLGRMSVRLDILAICQGVVSVVKLGDVAAKVLSNDKLASWVDLLITVCAEDQVITDYKRITFRHFFFNL